MVWILHLHLQTRFKLGATFHLQVLVDYQERNLFGAAWNGYNDQKKPTIKKMGLHLPKANRNNWQVRPRFELFMPPLCPIFPAHLPMHPVWISRKLLTLTEYDFRQAHFISESSVSSTVKRELRMNHISRKTTTEWEKIFAGYIVYTV